MNRLLFRETAVEFRVGVGAQNGFVRRGGEIICYFHFFTITISQSTIYNKLIYGRRQIEGKKTRKLFLYILNFAMDANEKKQINYIHVGRMDSGFRGGCMVAWLGGLMAW